MAKRRNKKLEWYAFRYDINTRSLVRFNVLGESFAEDVLERVKCDKIDNYDMLRERVGSLLRYYYWSKAEHEVLVTDILPRDGEVFKVDVWYQLEPNLDRIVEYIVKELKLDL